VGGLGAKGWGMFWVLKGHYGDFRTTWDLFLQLMLNFVLATPILHYQYDLNYKWQYTVVMVHVCRVEKWYSSWSFRQGLTFSVSL
jgi:hypothetical protein